jgi:ketosteroid isomerase-like protein
MKPNNACRLILPLLLAACGPSPQADLEAEGAELMQLSREWSDLVSTAPIEEWIGLWAEDAVLMPPDLPPIRGRAAIREYVEAAAQVPGSHISWVPEEVHVARSGDMAYMIERNVITVNDSLGDQITAHGKVITVWRKDSDGSWRNVVDMWNAAPPPQN